MTGFAVETIQTEALKKSLCEQYGFTEEMKIELLKYSENLTYQMETEDKRYVLRIYRPGYHDPEELYGEILWQKRLKEDTCLHLADILPGKNGKLLQQTEIGGKSYDIAVFTFVPGKVLRDLSGEKLYHYMEKMGEITGILHSHAIGWEDAGKLKRFHWDFRDLVGENARWGNFMEMKTLTDSQKKWYGEAVKIAEKRLQKYGKTRKRYGLIHGDLNINNILVDGETLYVLDFDDCGYGWFLYDLSTAVLEYFGETMERSLEALLKGYQKYRRLSKEDLEEMETFVVLRKIVRVGWIATHLDNDTVKKVDPAYYRETEKMAVKYCESGYL